jgi:hypothetical protein
MTARIRYAGAIAAGIAVASVLVVVVELFSAFVHPPPEGFQGTSEEVSQLVERYPHWVLAVAVVMWSATSLAATWVASRIGNRATGKVVALLLGSALVFNVTSLPYVLWFKVVMLTCFPIASCLGIRSGEQLSSAANRPSGRDSRSFA